MLWHLKRLDDAIAATNHAIRLNPNSFRGWYNQAVVLTDAGKFQAALQSYDRAIKINPKNAAALTGRGVVLSRLKRYTDAIVALQASLKVNPEQPLAQAALRNATQLKQNEEALNKPKLCSELCQK